MTPVGNYGPNPLSESLRPWVNASDSPRKHDHTDAAGTEFVCPAQYGTARPGYDCRVAAEITTIINSTTED